MKIIRKIQQLRKTLAAYRRRGKTISLVPTMGYFHEGHVSLMKQAKRETDIVVVSLFVNPLQFGPKDDLKKYPRDLRRDQKMAERAKVDILFVPEARDLYSKAHETYVMAENLAKPLCGLSRPGHFRGVATVVAKLFNIVGPDAAFFGRKDYQQARIIEKMIEDLSYNIRLRVLPTVREKDGLAMSSRNAYLSPLERKEAPKIYAALKAVRALYKKGERRVSVLEHKLKQELVKNIRGARLDYAEVREAVSLTRPARLKSKAVAAVAVRIGTTRLIDNITLGE